MQDTVKNFDVKLFYYFNNWRQAQPVFLALSTNNISIRTTQINEFSYKRVASFKQPKKQIQMCI